MYTNYADCEIEFNPREDKSYSLAIRSPGGDADGVLPLPTNDPAYQELAENLKNLQTDEEIITRIGQMLFGALFQGKIKERYVFSQGVLQAGQGLRLVLNIDAGEQAVGALPWEFLYDPDQPGPMALLDMPIVRYLPQPLRMPTLKTDLPLKVLLTGAQTPAPMNAIPVGARDQTPENITRELAEVHAALAGMGDHVRIEVEEHITTGKLRKFLRDGFHVWHFVGHGSVNADGTAGRLQFEDGDSGMKAVSAQELGILLNRSVRLVLLNSCQSAQLTLNPFRSVAPALIRAQIPAVVAMQFSVPQRSARAFAVEFYRALVEGFPIDACVTEGRKAVMNVAGLGQADWGIPVVYTRAKDGRLFDLPPIVPPMATKPDKRDVSPASNEGRAETAPPGTGSLAETLTSMGDSDLRDFLDTKFNENELRDLCLDLGIDYENLSGTNKRSKARELVQYCDRHGRKAELIAACARLRGNVGQPNAAQGNTATDGPKPATAERMLSIIQLRTRRSEKKDRLFELEIQQDRYGFSADPSIPVEIKRIRGEIAEIERQISLLEQQASNDANV